MLEVINQPPEERENLLFTQPDLPLVDISLMSHTVFLQSLEIGRQ